MAVAAEKSLPDPSAPLTDWERALLEKLLADPTQLPTKFKAWLNDYIGTNADIHVENVASLESILVPIGAVIAYGAATPPDNFLTCLGTAVSRTDYSKLFSVIGTTFGTGDGSTTFNLPNIKGKVIVGLDSGDGSFDALAETGGAKTHTLSIAEIPSHQHAHGDNILTPAGGENFFAAGAGGDIHRSQGSLVAAAGGGGSHNNLQPYITLHHIIRAA